MRGRLYTEQVTDGDQLRFLSGDTRARPRAGKLFEFDGDGVVTPGAVPVQIGTTSQVSFFNLGAAVAAAVPVVGFQHSQDLGSLYIWKSNDSPEGAYWWVERDQAKVMRAGGVGGRAAGLFRCA